MGASIRKTELSLTVMVLLLSIETAPVAVTTSSQPPETTTVLLGPTLKVPVLMAQGVALSAHCTSRKASVREEQFSIAAEVNSTQV
jgi:hypothetical protein